VWAGAKLKCAYYANTENQNTQDEKHPCRKLSFHSLKRTECWKATAESMSKLLCAFRKDVEEKNMFYWLCFGLWQGNFFRPFLTGSVIPFLRVEDLKEVIQEALSKIDHASLKESMTIIQSLQAHQENIARQLK
jgi:hypothetical protein